MGAVSCRRDMILFAHTYCFCLDFKDDLKSSKLVADEDVVEKKLLLRLLDQAKFLREASEHCILKGGYRNFFLFFHKSRWA